VAERLDACAGAPHITRDHGHGHGRDEHRTLIAAPVDPDDTTIRFPGARQVAQIVRDTLLDDGSTRGEVVLLITSLDAGRADPARLAEIARGHWGIENSSHWRRDVTYGEDRCRARTRHSPINLAALRNLTIALIARHRPKRFDRLRNAIAGSLPAILAILAKGSAMSLGYF
jgi:predicted transposase YbfD/YdcC